MKQIKIILSIMCLLVFTVFCSEDELGDFQQNDPEPEYRLFTLLDNYPALKSAIQSIDSYKFNDLMCEAMNSIPGDVKAVMEASGDMLLNGNTDMLASVRRILYRILYQDQLDRDPVSKTRDPGYAAKEFPYYDLISDAIDPATDDRINLIKPLLAMQRKMFGYLQYKFTDEELEQVVEDLVAHLRDKDANVMGVLFEVIGKLYFQTNDNIWHNEGTLCSRDDIDTEGAINSGLGNAVRGSDASFAGQEEEMKDPAFREAYYNLLRETGNMMSASVKAGGEEKKYSVVTKELICNLEKYFTKGGEVFESNDGNNNYNRGYLTEDGNGDLVVVGDENPDTGVEEFANAEFGNTLREMFAVLQSLFKRSDKERSILYDDPNKEPYYFVNRWVSILNQMGFDPDKAHLEEKIYDLVRFDVWGRDRLENMDDPDISVRPFAASHFNYMMLLVGYGENYGWLDRYRREYLPYGIFDGSDNFGHGHYETAGYLTMNDALANMGFNEMMGMNLYEIAVAGDPFDTAHQFRCMHAFPASEAKKYMLALNTEFPALAMMPTQIAGDAGVPWGGNPDGWSVEDYDVDSSGEVEADEVPMNRYRPYSPDGKGEPDIINMFLTSFVRFVWDGEGPFYSKEKMVEDGNKYTYYRQDNRIYVVITKPDPVNPLGTIINSNDPYCMERTDDDLDLLLDAFVADEAAVKGYFQNTYQTSYDGTLQPIIDSAISVGDVATIKTTFSKEDLEVLYKCADRYQQSDDWKYNYPNQGGEDYIWDASDPDFDPIFIEDYLDENGDPQRKNCRYYQFVKTDFFMMHLDDVKLYTLNMLNRDLNGDGDTNDPGEILGNGIYDVWVAPNESAGVYNDEEALRVKVVSSGASGPGDFNSGRMVMRELIPEKTLERECDSNLETLYRNLQFYLSEKKMAMSLPMYMYVSPSKAVAAVIDGPLGVAFAAALNVLGLGAPMFQAASFMMSEANGAFGMGSMRPIDYNSLTAVESNNGAIKNTNGAWKMKRSDSGAITGGQSYIPGDNRFNIIFLADDLFSAFGVVLNGGPEAGPAIAALMLGMLGFKVDIDITSGFPSYMLNHMLGQGAMLGGPMATAMPAFARMAFPRSVDPANPDVSIEALGSRKGELLKDRDALYKFKTGAVPNPTWGFELSDSDPNWVNRQTFLVEAFIPFQIVLREAGGKTLTEEEFLAGRGEFSPFAPSNDFCPSKAFLDTVMGAMMNPLMYYMPGDDGNYPRKSWMPRLIDNNSQFTRCDQVPGTTGAHSWEERAYYQPANVVNFLTMQSDTDPFGDFNVEPKRCDGFIPLITEYDVTRPLGPDNSPNTRLITALLKLAMAFADDKFDERPVGKTYDEGDFSTWTAREKIRYGTEQLVSSMKCRKGDRIRINETNEFRKNFWPEVFTYPDFMFSDKGKRPEDIDLDKLIDELIGSDETGKGLAIIPDNRPNPEDWNNFYLFFDSYAELLSNNGETGGRFNIMEDLIEFIDILNTPNATIEQLKGLRHTVGSIFTRYNESTGEWEYPNELLHIMTDIIPDILETFKGRYSSLCNITDALMREDGFVEYFVYTLDSGHSGREIFEQLYEFLGEDIIARHDSSFWRDLGELMIALAELINANNVDNSIWISDDFHTNRDLVSPANPFEGIGELFSW